jgi:hypothetical protein
MTDEEPRPAGFELEGHLAVAGGHLTVQDEAGTFWNAMANLNELVGRRIRIRVEVLDAVDQDPEPPEDLEPVLDLDSEEDVEGGET